MSERTCSFPECDRRLRASGLCNGHYQQRGRGKPLKPLRLVHPRNATDEERFFARVKQAGDCWLWVGAKNDHGYGQFSLRDVQTGARGTYAHRWAYGFLRDEIPAGLVLDHLCRNTSCVNPWHLEPVTQQINVLRGEHTTHGRTPPRLTAKWRSLSTT